MDNRTILSRFPALLVVLMLWAHALDTGVQAEQPRRDEEYPPPNFLKLFQIIHEVCVDKTGVTETAIKEFSDGDIHEDEALKCYMNCLFHEVDVVDDAGEMHYEKLKRIIPDSLKDYVMTMVKGCESHVPKGASQCDRAWSWHVCWKQMDPKHYFLP